jgi:hypothetical protein
MIGIAGSASAAHRRPGRAICALTAALVLRAPMGYCARGGRCGLPRARQRAISCVLGRFWGGAAL